MALRVERHVENARKVAEFLYVLIQRFAWVNYADFRIIPLYPMAHRYLGDNFCSLLTFGVKGGYEGGRKCSTLFTCSSEWSIWRCEIVDVSSASTTHRQVDAPRSRKKVGVTPEMIRLSVGIEHIEDMPTWDQAIEYGGKVKHRE